MRGSGHYRDRLTWMVRVDGEQEANGSFPDTYADQARQLHCRVEQPKGADKVLWGGLQSAIDAVIRVRGNPGVRSVDRLRDNTGKVYVLLGCTLDDDGFDQVIPAVGLTEGNAP